MKIPWKWKLDGKWRGLQSRGNSKNEQTMYGHCVTWQLNLCGVPGRTNTWDMRTCRRPTLQLIQTSWNWRVYSFPTDENLIYIKFWHYSHPWIFEFITLNWLLCLIISLVYSKFNTAIYFISRQYLLQLF